MSSKGERNESGGRLDADSDIETAVTSDDNSAAVGGNSKEMTDGRPLRRDKPSADSKAELEIDPVVEELSIQSSNARRLARWSRVALVGAAVLVVVALLVVVGAWGYGHLRHIVVSVNGTERQVSANATLGKLLADNGDFKAKKGKLLSVSGKVLKPAGGEPISCTIDGRKVLAGDDANATKLSEGAKITVRDGKDLIEDYDVQSTPIPFNVVMNGHGVIQKLKQHGIDGVSEVWKGKISGEQVNKGVIKNPQDLVVDTFSPKPEGRNVIALTFDDGPSEYSAQILDILKEKGVKATFFDVGQHSAAEPQMEQRMVAEGHQVASHSNTHVDMFKLNPQQLQAELSQSLDNIEKASGVTTKMLRAPYGNFGAEQWRYAGDLIDCNVMWSIDTMDWKLPGAQAISDAVLLKAYNGAVVLMHDGGGDRTQDVEALPGIIDGLKAQGFEFVTIDELMAMDGNQ
ncbi:peptidoglycan/xylan/chitin deacetylase (PgdA/CDA1 family) [Bifidobacterium commune]|nr:polysaccharide deacetylase family protein [Bifidobacterium commune]MBB2955532.1 peptidoglycan/xylan/chitin deacetylase (PgdA/CDA1 family) [Bifidobacterium commune]